MNINDKGQWEYLGGKNPTLRSIDGNSFYVPHTETLRDSMRVKTGRKGVLRYCTAEIDEGVVTPLDNYFSVRIRITKKNGESQDAFVLKSHGTTLLAGRSRQGIVDIPLDSGDTIGVYTENLSIGGTIQASWFASLIEVDI